MSLSALPSERLPYSTSDRESSNSPGGGCQPYLFSSYTEFFLVKLHSEGLWDEDWKEEDNWSSELRLF